MKPTTKFECMNEYCKTITLGNHRMDGISCPRCNGPVIPGPFTKKDILAVYECLHCHYSEIVRGDKEDHSQVKVCPGCKVGAFLDQWHKYKYSIEID